MDALAAAADAAAAAAVEEELLQQQENDEKSEVIDAETPNFDSRGFARFKASDKWVLAQVKTHCCANEHCSVEGVPLSQHLRCECCGYACHRSCQKNLVPTFTELKSNRICIGCVKALALLPASIRSGTRCKDVDSNDAKLTQFIQLKLRQMPLELMSQTKFNKLHQEYDDGLMDEDATETEDEDDDDDDFEEDRDDEMDEDEGESMIGCSETNHFVFLTLLILCALRFR
jgi:hypothetical protein